MTIVLTAVVFLLMIAALVAAHELGHYLFARWFRMDAEEFAIGFGRGKWTWMRKNGTLFTIRPIPLGGFVRIKGMIPEEDGSEVLIPGGFYSRPASQRFLVLLAGPLFSVAFGVLLLTATYSGWGMRIPVNEPVLGTIMPTTPVGEAGLQTGDRILAVEGAPVRSFFEVIERVRGHGPEPIAIEYERDGARAIATVKPIYDERPTPVISPTLDITNDRKRQWKIGATWTTRIEQVGIVDAVRHASYEPWRVGTGLAATLANAFSKPATAKDDIGGPGTIAVVTNAAVQQGLQPVMWLAAMLSITLGFINLLPVPPLDGGQMVIAFAEMLRGGRRLSMRVQTAANFVGMLLVMLLIVTVIAIDVGRFTGR